MKMIFVVFSIQENGKLYAIADTIRTGENLLAHCHRYNAHVCHLCENRKQAEELAAIWNASYIANGTHLWMVKA